MESPKEKTNQKQKSKDSHNGRWRVHSKPKSKKQEEDQASPSKLGNKQESKYMKPMRFVKASEDISEFQKNDVDHQHPEPTFQKEDSQKSTEIEINREKKIDNKKKYWKGQKTRTVDVNNTKEFPEFRERRKSLEGNLHFKSTKKTGFSTSLPSESKFKHHFNNSGKHRNFPNDPKSYQNGINKEESEKKRTPRMKKTKEMMKNKQKTPDSSKKQNSNKRLLKKLYEPFYTLQQVEEGIKEGKLYKGKLRINLHNKHQAYATVDGLSRDVCLDTTVARNRAFDNDTVVIELNDISKWKVVDAVPSKEEALDTLLEDQLVESKDSPHQSTGVPDPLVDNPTDKSFQIAEQINNQDPWVLAASPQREFVEENTRINEDEEGDEEPEEESDEEEQINPPLAKSFEEDVFNMEDIDKAIHKIQQQNDKNILGMPPVVPPGKELQPTGRVVFIFSQEERLQDFIGFIHPQNPEGPVKPDDKFCTFIPLDIKVPKFLIPIGQVPNFYRDLSTYKNKLVVAKMVAWREESFFPLGKFLSVLGEAGEIRTETEAILRMNKVDSRDFPTSIIDSIPSENYLVPESEIQQRRDLRKERVFTIDPPTAKDLDDALSINPLPDGNYLVGVHIADVSHFVQPNTPLDIEASKRATTVYLVQKAIPMLPNILCEYLCSLNPGVDRLAFSVMWKLSSTGEILEEWFGKTVIRSCSKMPYNVAQQIIEGKIKQSWAETGVDELYKELGPFDNHTVFDIAQDILSLQSIAANLRSKRFENGALSMHNAKIVFDLDTFGNPIGIRPYIQKDANQLIEEFMLLANMRVALKISSTFPDTSLLRNHIPPQLKKLESWKKFCNSLGFNVDTSNSKTLSGSLQSLQQNTSPLIFRVLQMMGTKSMQLAKYFCTGDLHPSLWRHFALNMEYYTHFTSPIRRYADLIVHRLLNAALLLDNHQDDMHEEYFRNTFGTLPDKKKCSEIASHCNEKKLLARKAQEASDNLYLCLYLKSYPLMGDAVVIGLGERFIEVAVVMIGEEHRLYLEDMCIQRFEWNSTDKKLNLYWPRKPGNKNDSESPIEQELSILSVVKVHILTKPDKLPLQVNLRLLHPIEIQ